MNHRSFTAVPVLTSGPARLIMALALVAILSASLSFDPVGGPLRTAWAEEAANPRDNPIVRQVIEQLREKTGREPDMEAIVGALNGITVALYQKGNYPLAEQSARTGLALTEAELGPEHPDTLTSLNNLAGLYQSQGRYSEAEPLYQRALAASERVLGKEHPDTLSSLGNLALLYQAQGRYGEAEPLLQRVLATRERVLGRKHPDTLASLNDLALLYDAQGRYGEAEPLYQRALAARERVLGKEHPDTLTSLNDLALLYKEQGRYSEAEPLYQRTLAARERLLGKEHPDTLASLNNLAWLYDAQGRYGEAEPLFKQALAARERVLGKEYPDTLQSLNNLALLYQNQGRYGEAEPLLQQALTAYERILGKEHPDTLLSLNNLAGLYEKQGRYGEAEPLLQQALTAYERILGKEHPDTLLSLNNLAGLYEKQGRYGDAELLYQQALATRERVLGKEHPNSLTSLNNLAVLYYAQGRYGEAEPLFKQALAASERVLGEDHPYTLNFLNNLAALYDSQGRYGKAEPLYQRALATRERVLGKEHPDTLISLGSLAVSYDNQGRYGTAEPLLRQVLATSERILGKKHPYTLAFLNNLAMLYQKQGRYGEATPLYQRALAARERVLGKEHPDTLTSLNNLAALYNAQGRYGKAEPLYERALAIRERLLGEKHPYTLGIQLNLAVSYIEQGNFSRALAHLREMDGRLQGFVGAQLASTRSEQVRRRWLRSESGFQSAVFTLATAASVPEKDREAAQELAANVLLRWKRLAGAGEAVIARSARASENPEVRSIAAALAEARSQLAHQVNRPEPDPEAIANARAEVERREVELAALSGAFQRHLAERGVNWRQVQNALPEGAALLSLRVFQPFDFKTGEAGEPRWLGMVIAKGSEADGGLLLEDLGPVAAITPAFVELHRASRYAALVWGDEESEEWRAALHLAARDLYARLFGKLDKKLAQYEHLYIAPDGPLELAAFARLVLPDGRYWAERQQLHRLRAGRDLVSVGCGERAARTASISNPIIPDRCGSPNGSPHPTKTLVAFGGVDYNRFPTGGGPLGSAAPLGERSRTTASNRRLREERGTFETLPATGPEAMVTVQRYREFSNHRAKAWYGAEASEGRLKALLGPSATPPRVLHLATHGFFLQGRSGRTERPMTLGGLALAGANRGMEEGKLGPDGEDGILYAMEARDLNLEGTELVVLSACDTGQGEVDYSEGVYGLTRAFRIAGAKNILMTLWPLNDQLAAEFMADFYRNWLGGGDSTTGGSRLERSTPATALHLTRLAWIGSEDEKRRDPRYWAPYVLVE
uniref:Tetratricopeptide repeat-containing protein n=1 Tax=Candidatus Kentrum sp. FM TaxID=2126340 RepID=A0A450WAY7_9GAMM|nr:MAG: Tetratricopeptide repeat-containing protein [Candidatus Kentron sp. FM]